MLFDSGHKERVKRRFGDLRSEPAVLEMLLRTTPMALAEVAGLAADDIQPGLRSLDSVIAALRNSNHPVSESALADMEKTRSRYFNESVFPEVQIVS
jgi:hypothetical protein